ncbi:MAG TPA: ATP-dependent DNA helicase RecG [Actinomycetota bacterium]|nr:ATP-dependent DNA helicase RecG [Actinomycetota bacterium]
MPETVSARSRGLELFAPRRRGAVLRVSIPRVDALAKLGIESVQDLLQHYPRYHVDRTQLRTVNEIVRGATATEGEEVQVLARVVKMGRPIPMRSKKPGARRTMIKATIGDETGTIEVTWFNQDWIARALAVGTEAFFYGKLRSWKGKVQMTAPRFEPVKTGKEPFNVGRIIPIYPATAELTSDTLRRIMWDALQHVGPLMDPLPEAIRRAEGLMTRTEAIRAIHFPDAKEDVIQARRRIVFDELLTLQLGLVYRKLKLERTVQGIAHGKPAADSLAETFVAELPFKLTGAQRTACDEVAGDMTKTFPMHRLLEGEVGSGKTVVAVYACLVAVEGGFQAAFMAPTEVLAEQHYLTVTELLDRAFGAAEAKNLFAGVSRRPVARLLTGSTAATARSATLDEVASGEVDVLIGTHALIQEGVSFARLGVAVVDEQHRFGVHQRKSLREKGEVGEPDILVMTATPIPRTLAVTVYGDLDVSILDELPKGRMPVQTSIAVGEDARDKAYDLIRDEVAQGRQAFVVYALREESAKVELRSAKAEATRLREEVFPDLRVGLVHGDMKSADKESTMASFRDGAIDVLVATTVIEVGVDVPNATVMLIESAERFGLAQLHQLRGRVGRGAYASHCILATDLALDDSSPTDKVAAERLSAVAATRDGFELAMTDLGQRGEGQLFGARQSGMPQLKMVRVLKHQAEIKRTRDLAMRMLEDDPELRAYEHEQLRGEMFDRFPEQALDVVQSG